MSLRDPRLRALMVLYAVLPAAWTGAIYALGIDNAAPLGPQITALPPLDLFHDLRWILLYGTSWWTTALLAVGAAALRAGWVTGVLRVLRPDTAVPKRVMFTRAFAAYCFMIVVLLPWTSSVFALDVVGLPYLFYSGMPGAIGMALAAGQAMWAYPGGRTTESLPGRRSIAWMAAAVAWLTASGALISIAPVPGALAIAAATGILNQKAARAVVAATQEGSDRGLKHLVLAGVIVGVYAFTIGLAMLMFTGRTVGGSQVGEVTLPSSSRGTPVLVAHGFVSTWKGRKTVPLPPRFEVWQYSYRGMRGRTFLPYRPVETHGSLIVLARRMQEQVRALYDVYEAPVKLVAESEGALVTRTYLELLAHEDRVAIGEVVLLSMPSVQPSVYYPPHGDSGWGYAGGWTLRALTDFVTLIGNIPVDADSAFVRSLLSCDGLAAAIATSETSVPQYSVQSIGDAVAMNDPLRDVPVDRRYVVLADHGGLTGNGVVVDKLEAIFAGRAPRSSRAMELLYRGLGALSQGWHMAALPTWLSVGDARCPGPAI